ncbi:hypothetical protein ACWGNE_09380 [Streptomyces xiamenensis]|uniref:hypothetical protein n=1 Tax=Streptomyces xiamenensis TaxID=408015 RepID=UPI00069DB18C|nr:hypothetical protein [Streptomyces xiamenensis]
MNEEWGPQEEEPEEHEDEAAEGENIPWIDMPDLSDFYSASLPSVHESLVNPLTSYYEQYNDLSRILTEAIRTWPVPRVVIPDLGLTAAMESIHSQFADLTRFNDAIRQALQPYTAAAFQAARWQNLFSSITEAARSIYPENLRELAPSLDELEPLLVDEGIPLMWVPGPGTARDLLAAPDAAARRRLIGQRWKGVTNDCEGILDEIRHPALKDARGFALDVVSALRDGHTSAAQALAANLLDSLLQRHFSKALRIKLTKNDFKEKGIRFELDAYKFKVACTFAPVWYAHARYYPADGDPIPRTFGRHPSAHGVSRLQYSRINTIYALMLVTTVIKFFDTELPR